MQRTLLSLVTHILVMNFHSISSRDDSNSLVAKVIPSQPPHLTISVVTSFELFLLSLLATSEALRPYLIEVMSSCSSQVSRPMENYLQTFGPLRHVAGTSFLCFVGSILISSWALCKTQGKPCLLQGQSERQLTSF